MSIETTIFQLNDCVSTIDSVLALSPPPTLNAWLTTRRERYVSLMMRLDRQLGSVPHEIDADACHACGSRWPDDTSDIIHSDDCAWTRAVDLVEAQS